MPENTVITGAATIWELIEQRAEASPDHPMLFDASGRSLTFGAFAAAVTRCAAGFVDLGVGDGTRVSWQLPTTIEAIIASGALARLGAVQNPIIHLYKEREVGFALAQTVSELLVVPGTWRGVDYLEIATRAKDQSGSRARIIDLSLGLPDADPAQLPPAPVVPTGSEAPIRWIYYTSGSTAEPKGVQHTDQTLIAGGWGLAKALDMSPSDVGSIAFPFAHIAGPDYLVTMLSLGFPAVLLEAFVPTDAIEVFNRHDVTMVGGSTAFYVAYLTEQR